VMSPVEDRAITDTAYWTFRRRLDAPSILGQVEMNLDPVLLTIQLLLYLDRWLAHTPQSFTETD
jgi:hypothetical protein